ncbi:MAG TPA: aromatic ring-hydroxylating dioxygenase subunit alpha, partial [Dehalococcoidia bacterium]
MLTPEANEIVNHYGPGTAMGNLMRRYWLPALLSSELPGPDCDPVKVRIL